MSREEKYPVFQKITELSKYIAVRHCFMLCNQSLLAEGLRTVETILLSKMFIPLHLCYYRHFSSLRLLAPVCRCSSSIFFTPEGLLSTRSHRWDWSLQNFPPRLSKYPSEYASAASKSCENCHFSKRKKVFWAVSSTLLKVPQSTKERSERKALRRQMSWARYQAPHLLAANAPRFLLYATLQSSERWLPSF